MCKNEAIAFLVAYSYHFFPIKCERRKAKACNSRSIASVWLFIAFNNKKLVQLTSKFWNHWLSVKQKQSDLFRQFFRKKARIFAITCVPRAKWSSLVSVTNENSVGIGLWTPENIVYWLLFSYLSLACVFWILKKTYIVNTHTILRLPRESRNTVPFWTYYLFHVRGGGWILKKIPKILSFSLFQQCEKTVISALIAKRGQLLCHWNNKKKPVAPEKGPILRYLLSCVAHCQQWYAKGLAMHRDCQKYSVWYLNIVSLTCFNQFSSIFKRSSYF